MGRGKKATSAGDNAPPKKMKGDWESSTISERQLASLRADGRLLPAASGKVRFAGNEVIPIPHADERVVFVDFLTRGLSFPLHEFV